MRNLLITLVLVSLFHDTLMDSIATTWSVQLVVPSASGSSIPCGLFVGEQISFTNVELNDLSFTRIIDSSYLMAAPTVTRMLVSLAPEELFQNVQYTTAVHGLQTIITVTASLNALIDIPFPYNVTFELVYALDKVITSSAGRNSFAWSVSSGTPITTATTITFPAAYLNQFSINDVKVGLVPSNAVQTIEANGDILTGASESNEFSVSIDYPEQTSCAAPASTPTPIGTVTTTNAPIITTPTPATEQPTTPATAEPSTSSTQPERTLEPTTFTNSTIIGSTTTKPPNPYITPVTARTPSTTINNEFQSSSIILTPSIALLLIIYFVL
jgi:hypothetical protein